MTYHKVESVISSYDNVFDTAKCSVVAAVRTLSSKLPDTRLCTTGLRDKQCFTAYATLPAAINATHCAEFHSGIFPALPDKEGEKKEKVQVLPNPDDKDE